MRILQELAIALKALKGPWVVAGDWNLTPEVLRASRWPELVGGVVVATASPTCHQSTYDYFVVSDSLAHAIAGVQRVDDAGFSPQYPARLLMRGDARRQVVRRLARPSKVPGLLPSGPQLPPPSYDNIGVGVASATGIDSAFDQWYRLARTEFGSLLGCAPQYAAPHFRWLAAAGPLRAARGGRHAPLCRVARPQS